MTRRRGAWVSLAIAMALGGCAPVAPTAGPSAPATVTAIAGDCAGAHQTEIAGWQSQKVDRLPEIVQRTPPTYPENALEAGVDGDVVIEVLICADGGVHETRVVRSVPMLDEAAVDAVRQWIFHPATLGGESIAAWVEARVEFKLPPKGAATEVR